MIKYVSFIFKIALVFFPVFFINCKKGFTDISIYGEVPPAKFLTGKFDPASNKQFISLNVLKLPVDNKKHFLHKEAASALKKMYSDFIKDNPGKPFKIVSSARNYDTQKRIWENKWNGRRKVDGKRLNETIKDPQKRGLEILKYSSMPGTSRHHWGTDFDLNVLNNNYFSKGDGLFLYNWLKQNAHKYGFCQPYTSGRKSGYYEEKWHWSYMPLASKFLKDWNRYFGDIEKFRGVVFFDGAQSIYIYSNIYVNSINRECE